MELNYTYFIVLFVLNVKIFVKNYTLKTKIKMEHIHYLSLKRKMTLETFSQSIKQIL